MVVRPDGIGLMAIRVFTVFDDGVGEVRYVSNLHGRQFHPSSLIPAAIESTA